jgi:hypothetical protein
VKRYLFLPIPAIALFAGAALAQDPAKTGNSVATGNESVIEQIGSSNGASADQSKIGGGSGNYSEVYQGLNNNASSGNSASVQQVAAGGAKNAARTSQDGSNNTAATLQNTNAPAAGGGSVTFVCPPSHSPIMRTLHLPSPPVLPRSQPAASHQASSKATTPIRPMFTRAPHSRRQPEPRTPR